MCDIAGIILPCLLTLANSNDPICVASPKVAKASTIRIAVAGDIAGVIALTFANGNTALVFQAESLLTGLSGHEFWASSTAAAAAAAAAAAVASTTGGNGGKTAANGTQIQR
jgi:hypothetical protein